LSHHAVGWACRDVPMPTRTITTLAIAWKRMAQTFASEMGTGFCRKARVL
jgi:hypothetical protein